MFAESIVAVSRVPYFVYEAIFFLIRIRAIFTIHLEIRVLYDSIKTPLILNAITGGPASVMVYMACGSGGFSIN